MRAIRLPIIALLLLALPSIGMAAYTPIAQPPCPMHAHDGPTKSPGAGMDCCEKAGLTGPCAKHERCAHCVSAHLPLALEFATPHLVAANATVERSATDFLPSSITSYCWRPPRAV